MSAWDVVIVGGGPAGLSAAVFLGREGLHTLVLDRGKSAIRQCAHLENYLGFPGGVDPETLLSLGREQARLAGCELVEEQAVQISRTPEGFCVRTKQGSRYEARRVIAASVYDMEYVKTLDPALIDDNDWFVKAEDGGRTSVAGFYAAGRIAGVEHQAIIAAGHGARVAIGIIREIQQARYWKGYNEHGVDWIAHEGRWGGEKWDRDIDEWIASTAPEGTRPETIAAAQTEYKQDAARHSISKEERVRRVEQGRALLLKHVTQEDQR